MNTYVVVLSFNHPKQTQRCIESLFKAFNSQSILLVHHGSTNECVCGLKEQFPGLCHLVLESNGGFSRGMNEGMRYFMQHSSAAWCLCVTNDTELISCDLSYEKMQPCLVAPLIYFRSLRKIDSFGATFNAARGSLSHVKDERSPWTQSRYVPGTAFIFHRDVLSRDIYFDEKLFMFWEDVLWSYQLEMAGVRLVQFKGLSFAHGGGKTTKKDALYTAYYFHRNRLIVSVQMQKSYYKKFLSYALISSNLLMKVMHLILRAHWSRCLHTLRALYDATKVIIRDGERSSALKRNEL